MPFLRVETCIAADRQRLYSLAQDYRHRVNWDRFVYRVKYADGAFTSCVSLGIATPFFRVFAMEVEYIAILSPTMLSVNMLSGPKFLAKLDQRWRFEALDHQNTRVIVESNFSSRWPILSGAIDPLFTRLFKRDLNLVLADFKYVAEQTDIVKFP